MVYKCSCLNQKLQIQILLYIYILTCMKKALYGGIFCLHLWEIRISSGQIALGLYALFCTCKSSCTNMEVCGYIFRPLDSPIPFPSDHPQDNQIQRWYQILSSLWIGVFMIYSQPLYKFQNLFFPSSRHSGCKNSLIEVCLLTTLICLNFFFLNRTINGKHQIQIESLLTFKSK